MAGYSGTPLAKKLGIKPGTVISVVNAPRDYAALLDPLPENVTFVEQTAAELDVAHLFTRTRSELAELLGRYRRKIKQSGAIWVSWPQTSVRFRLRGHRGHSP